MLFLIVTILVCSAFTQASGQQCWLEGACDGGLVIGVSVADSKEGCLQFCQLDPECQWFTYFVSSSICTKFSGNHFTDFSQFFFQILKDPKSPFTGQ